jgi:hypothetical protein
MNLDELNEVWNSSGNRPTVEQRDEMINRFTMILRRRRRKELGWLVWTFFVLMLLTGFACWLLLGTNKVHLPVEWGVIPLLLIPWVFAGLFLKRFLRRPARMHRGDVTIAESLAAAMAANKAERSKLKTVGIMYLITLPVLAFAIWQLHTVGKVSSRELVSMVTFLGSALTVSAGAVLFRYRFGLRPEGHKLKVLLSQFEQVVE